MNDAVHIDVEVIGLKTRGIGFCGVKRHADGAAIGGEMDAFFEDILDDFGVFFRKPAIEGWDSHGCRDFSLFRMRDFCKQNCNM